MTLCEQGLLSRSGNDFEPGGALFRLGIRALSSQRLRRFAVPVMQRLAADLQETTQLVTLSGSDALVLEVVRRAAPRANRAGGAGPTSICTATPPARCCSPSRCGRSLPALVAQGLAVRTPNTLTTLPDLDAEVSRILGLGYAVDDEECYEGVRCLAAPVWDATGGTRAALGVIASASTFSRRQNQEFAQRVLAAARELSTAMGYDERPPHD